MSRSADAFKKAIQEVLGAYDPNAEIPPHVLSKVRERQEEILSQPIPTVVEEQKSEADQIRARIEAEKNERSDLVLLAQSRFGNQLPPGTLRYNPNTDQLETELTTAELRVLVNPPDREEDDVAANVAAMERRGDGSTPAPNSRSWQDTDNGTGKES